MIILPRDSFTLTNLTNVATEMSCYRNGQTESARPKRLRPKWLRPKRLRPKRPDRKVVYPIKNKNLAPQSMYFPPKPANLATGLRASHEHNNMR